MRIYRWTHNLSGATGTWSEDQYKVIAAKGWLKAYAVVEEVVAAPRPFMPPEAVAQALSTGKKKTKDQE